MKTLFITLILISLSLSSFAQDKFKEAENLVKKKEYNKAYTIADDLYKAGDFNETIKVLMMLKEKDNSAKVIELLGDTYLKIKVLELALSNYEEVEKMDLNNIGIKFKISGIYFKQKDYKSAGNKLLEIYKLDSTNVNALVELSTLFYQAKMYPEASLYLSKLLLYQNKEEYFNWIVRAYMENRNYPKANEYAKQGLILYPENPLLKKNQFRSALSIGISDSTYLIEAGNLSKTLPDSLIEPSEIEKIAKIYQFNRKIDTVALEYYLFALTRTDTLTESMNYAVQLSYKLKKFDLVASLYDKKIAKDSTNAMSYKYKGMALFQSEKYEDAINTLKQASAIADTDISIIYWLGQAYSANKQDNLAIEQNKLLLKKIEGNEKKFKDEEINANSFIGIKYFAAKKYQDALPYIKKAVELQPSNANFNLMLASCYHNLERLNEAITYYKIVVKLEPKNQAAHKALKSLGEE